MHEDNKQMSTELKEPIPSFSVQDVARWETVTDGGAGASKPTPKSTPRWAMDAENSIGMDEVSCSSTVSNESMQPTLKVARLMPHLPFRTGRGIGQCNRAPNRTA